MIAWLFLVILLLLLLVYLYVQTQVPFINQVDMWTDRLPAGQEIRILHVSDLHNLHLQDAFLAQLSATQPDLIAVTGDLIHGRERHFKRVYRLFDHLQTMSDAIFFVSGNNDGEHKRYLSLLQDLKKRGTTVLNNKHHELTLGASVFRRHRLCCVHRAARP